MENRLECYKVGSLLYSPANKEDISNIVINNKLGNLYSLALCLEDSISDDSVEKAEIQLIETIKNIYNAYVHGEKFYLPKIFIRVREPKQLDMLYNKINPYIGVVFGFIFPKYSLYNGEKYNQIIKKINAESKKIIYMMPILESKDIIDFSGRKEVLIGIKKLIDDVKEYVLNVRVGGNDFCNQFATRRHYNETIYDILPIAGMLGDILTVFSRDYVVSGPVWEFFASDNNEWKDGLIKELALDKLNGFVGKTVVHPKQISVVNEAMKVSQKDYEDAKAIMNWESNSSLGVSKSSDGQRMNEVKTHENWARKTLILADIYGIN